MCVTADSRLSFFVLMISVVEIFVEVFWVGTKYFNIAYHKFKMLYKHFILFNNTCVFYFTVKVLSFVYIIVYKSVQLKLVLCYSDKFEYKY